jgi:hypothetical protein
MPKVRGITNMLGMWDGDMTNKPAVMSKVVNTAELSTGTLPSFMCMILAMPS